jgi:hypothetical protein
MSNKFDPFNDPKDAAVGKAKAFELFQRVLLEGPRADEFEYTVPPRGFKLVAGCRTPRSLGNRWRHADYVPNKRGYVQPDPKDLRDGCVPDIYTRCDWFIRVMPHAIIGSYGVWVRNPRLDRPDHLFGREGMLGVPEEQELDRNDPNYLFKLRERFQRLGRHAYHTDDEIVEAAIRCIKGAMRR